MDTKELLAQLAKFEEATEEDIKDLATKDEQEAEDGMNLLEQEVKEDIDQENELAELKAKKRIYTKAVEALEELQNFLWEGVSPSTGKLDPDTEEFNQLINSAIAEIHSRSLAFD